MSVVGVTGNVTVGAILGYGEVNLNSISGNVKIAAVRQGSRKLAAT